MSKKTFSLLRSPYIKTSTSLIVKKKDGKLIIENKSNKKERLIFSRVITTSGSNFFVSNRFSKISGKCPEIKIVSRKLKVLESIETNCDTYIRKSGRIFMIGITCYPGSACELEKLDYRRNQTCEESFKKYFDSDNIVICPGYPSESDHYNCSFIHSRVSEYKNHGINVDIAVVNGGFSNKTEFYTYEGQKLCRMSFDQARELLQERSYKKILVHFPTAAYYRILDAVNTKDSQIILYSHGTDTLYHLYDEIGAPYSTNHYKAPKNIVDNMGDMDAYIKKYNERKNVKYVFVSEWAKKKSEDSIGIKYKNSAIIPCFIDDQLFSYKKKDEELRKKVFIIRPQNNLKSYAMDINVRVILELSHRECFKDMEFSIYGDGELHYTLLEPLRKFKNVHIYRKFLSHDEIAEIHKNNGIGLFASRFDTQSVSACEAAMSGNVVISSYGTGMAEYISPEIGSFCDVENYKAYADLIEKLYNNPSLFSEMSKKMHDSAFSTCSYKYSLKKDIDLIKNFNEVEEITIPTIEKKPVLSISIAAYNISKYVIQVLCSLIRAKNANRLEILLVDDGSSDDTVKKAKKFISDNYHGKGEPIIKVIAKKNGGHGSTINKGLELATGKYFRLLDGDDYFVTSELDRLIEILENEDADLILTNYIEDQAKTGKFKRMSMYDDLTPGIEYSLDDITYEGYGFGQWGPLLSTSTYKTKLLQEANFKIDENCFYVDMEYNLMGIIVANTVKYYPIDLYAYYIGRDGQSVSPASFKKNALHHEKVCLRLLEEYTNRINDITDGKKKYIVDKMIIPLCNAQYYIATEYFNDNRHFNSFDKKFKKYPEFYNNYKIVGRKAKILRKTNGNMIPVIRGLLKIVKR